MGRVTRGHRHVDVGARLDRAEVADDRVAAVGRPVTAAVRRDLAGDGVHVERRARHRRRAAGVGRRQRGGAQRSGRGDAVHRQPVERRLRQRLAVVDAGNGERREVPLLGEHERLTRGRRAAGELARELGQQALGVRDARRVAVAEAGVADERAAALGELLGPVAEARLARRAVAVDGLQARVAADREEQAAGRRRGVLREQQAARRRRRQRAVVVEVAVDRRDPAAGTIDVGQRVVRRPGLVDARLGVARARQRREAVADRRGAVGEEVIARHARAADRQHAVASDVLIDLRRDLGGRLDEAPEADVGHGEAAAEPGLGVEVAVGIVGQDLAAPQRPRDRRVVAAGGQRVGLLTLVADPGEVGHAGLR